jgi:uncharacterized protein YndB with AHSA1/START domain
VPSQPVPELRWRIHLASSPEAVYELLSTEEGRAQFWAESAVERDGAIEFTFPNGMQSRAAVLAAEPPGRFALDYFGSRTTFELEPDGDGGTDLTLSGEGDAEVLAGWVSVLLALKAAADFGVDLRNHDPGRTWSQGYCDN